MTNLIVAKRPGVERKATKQETCQHWMIPKRAWSGGKQHTRCAFCGLSGTKDIK